MSVVKESINIDWIERSIKGKIGEILATELFQSCGFEVYSFGSEIIAPHLKEIIHCEKDAVSLNVRRLPDLVIYDPTNKKKFFIDVKFRSNGRFKSQDVKDNPHDDAYIVLLTPHQIMCAQVKELKREKVSLKHGQEHHLGRRKEFGFTTSHRRIILKYRDLMSKIYSKAPFTKSEKFIESLVS